MTALPVRYPADIFPASLCYSTERLCASAGLVPIVVQKIDGSVFSANFTDDHLPAGYATFLAGEPYGSVITVTNQMPNGAGHLSIGGNTIAPRMRPDLHVGPSPGMIFQGGTDQGRVWGLDIAPNLQALAIRPDYWTVMAVLRPTTSMARNQNNTPGDADYTILSLDTKLPIIVNCKTTVGSDIIENVPASAGVAVGDRIDGVAFQLGAQVLQVFASPSGPSFVNVRTFGAGANRTEASTPITFSNPVARLYQSGDASPGSFAMSDERGFGGDVRLQPQHFSGVEIQPVVVAWTMNSVVPGNDVLGQKIWMNEIIRSGAGLSLRGSEVISTGFIGRMGGSMKHPVISTRSGDFWLGALIVWNFALTQAQRAIVADALYRRFAIDERRSIRSSKSVWIMGDSIAMDYTTFANYGWSKRLADKFSSGVRFLNYAVPGSQVTTAPRIQEQGYTEGLFRVAVAQNGRYSTGGKNALVVLAGGNDMVDQTPYKYTANPTTNEINVFLDVPTDAAAAIGSNVLHFAATPRWLSVGAIVLDLTNVTAIPPGTTVAAVTDNTVTLSAAVAAPGVASGDVIRFRYHNMQPGMRMQFSSLPMDTQIPPQPLITGIAVGPVYYVREIRAVNRYTLAATPGGAEIDIGGTFLGECDLIEYTKTAAGIFGTPTTHGLQRIVADALAAGISKVFLLTVLKRTGLPYDYIREDLNALIMGGGAGGYTPINCDDDPTLANNDSPPGTAGPAYPDGTHLNELGSDALANFFYPTLLAYLNS